MKFLKSLKINALVTAIIYVAVGLLFVLLPEEVSQSISVILGIVLAIAGIAYIIDYFRKWDIEYKSNGLAIGILLLFGAIFFLFQNAVIAELIPLLLGFAVVVSGTIKLQNAIVLMKSKERMWIPVLVLAVITLALGIIIMVDPFYVARSLAIFIGASLLVSGVTDLVIIFLMSRRSEELKRAGKPDLDRNIIDMDHVKSPKDAVTDVIQGLGADTDKPDEKHGDTK